MGRNIKIVYFSILHFLAVYSDIPYELIIAQIAEEIFIIDFDFTRIKVDRRGPNILIVVPCFIHMRVRYAVRTYESVAVEVVVGRIISIVIATIFIYIAPLCVLSVQPLVYEIPNKTALKLGIFAH